jgi:hypothetical protein
MTAGFVVGAAFAFGAEASIMASSESRLPRSSPTVIPDLIRDPDGVAASVADIALTGGGNARQWQ